MFNDSTSLSDEPFGDRIAVRAPVGLRPRVHAVARAHGITSAELIRRAIEEHVSRLTSNARADR